MDYDKATAFLGHWGCFQMIVFFLLTITAIPNGTSILCLSFITAIPHHHCHIPESNLSQDWLDAVIPVKDVSGKLEQSSCSRYQLDLLRNFSAQGLVPGRDVNLTDLPQESCLDGWSYSKDIYQSTLVTQFDLVCSQQWKAPFTTTIYFLGVLVGSLFSGYMSDRFGRKPVLIFTMMVQTTFIFLQIFSPSWPVFSVLLFVSSLGQVANFVSAFVLGNELFVGKVRNRFGPLGICLFCSVGFLIMPLFAYFLRDWKSLLMIISLPCLIYVPLFWLIPESPRWLLTQGRMQEAEAIVRKAARMNKVEPPPVIFQNFSVEPLKNQHERVEKYNIIHLFRISSMRMTTIILCFIWFTTYSGYYGLTFNAVQLSDNPFLGTFMSVASELPALVCVWLVMEYSSRRVPLMISLLLGGASLLFIQLVPSDLSELSIVLELLGKGGFTVACNLLYSYTTEIYPTAVRTTGCGLCSTVSRIGTCILPFLFQLGSDMPYVILGFMAILCSIASFFLPETFGKPLPQRVQDMPTRESLRCCCVATREQLHKAAGHMETQL